MIGNYSTKENLKQLRKSVSQFERRSFKEFNKITFVTDDDEKPEDFDKEVDLNDYPGQKYDREIFAIKLAMWIGFFMLVVWKLFL